MTRPVIWFVLLIAFLVGARAPALAEPGAKPTTTAETVSAWMMDYYRDPHPDRVPDVILALDGMAKEAGGTMFMTGFLSAVFEANPAKVSNWLKEIDTLPE